MKREYEIERQATIYSDISGNYIEWGDGWQDYDDQVYVEKAFIEGAKWADETMIEKTCDWLKEKNKLCMYELEMILGRNFIEDFKKAMEEQL